MQHHKIAVITGANSGIGYEIAKGLAANNYHIVLACRNQKKGLKAQKSLKASLATKIDFLPLDLACFQSIKNFVIALEAKTSHLNLLVNNAGFFPQHYQKTADGFAMSWGVNYLGHFFLTEMLLKTLLKATPAKIINISSRAALFSKLKVSADLFRTQDKGFKAYAKTKLAQLYYNAELAAKFSLDQLQINAVFPGRVATNIWRGDGLLMRIMRPIMLKTSISAEKGAETALELAFDSLGALKSGEVFEQKKMLSNAKKKLEKKTQQELMKISYQEFLTLKSKS